jgi:hypothetical protein
MDGLEYTFKDTIKIWQGSKSTWHYVSLPLPMSDEVHTLCQYHQTKRRGWGAVRVSAQIGAYSWQTSIFPAFEHQQYHLFLKADIRKRAKIAVGDEISVRLQLLFGVTEESN